MSTQQLTKGECVSCKAEVLFGGVAVKKVREKFNLDGTTIHQCKPKEQKNYRKPSETFRYVHWVKINDGVADQFEVSRTGNVGELDPLVTFGELKAIVARLPK